MMGVDENGVNRGKCLDCDEKYHNFRPVKRDPCCGYCGCPPGFHTNEDESNNLPKQHQDEEADIDANSDSGDGNLEENNFSADAEINNDSSPDSPLRNESDQLLDTLAETETKKKEPVTGGKKRTRVTTKVPSSKKAKLQARLQEKCEELSKEETKGNGFRAGQLSYTLKLVPKEKVTVNCSVCQDVINAGESGQDLQKFKRHLQSNTHQLNHKKLKWQVKTQQVAVKQFHQKLFRK